jgi:hypothetical protein
MPLACALRLPVRVVYSCMSKSMIPKSGYRFSEKIMRKQKAKAKWRVNLIPFRFSKRARFMSLRQMLFAVLVGALASALAMGFFGCAGAADRSQPIPCEDIDSVGRAKMSADGTITLQLRSLWPDPVAEAQLVFPPDDPQYEEIKHHLGGITPGESKPVPPFCGLNSEP